MTCGLMVCIAILAIILTADFMVWLASQDEDE